MLQNTTLPSLLNFLWANSASCNSTTSVFIHFKNKTTFFFLLWTVESLYIQRNGIEIWINLTILRITLIQFLWTEKYEGTLESFPLPHPNRKNLPMCWLCPRIKCVPLASTESSVVQQMYLEAKLASCASALTCPAQYLLLQFPEQHPATSSISTTIIFRDPKFLQLWSMHIQTHAQSSKTNLSFGWKKTSQSRLPFHNIFTNNLRLSFFFPPTQLIMKKDV